jgi:iron complex transport system substrate-binding protein
MRVLVCVILTLLLFSGCSSVGSIDSSDNRFIVLGPSLVELMFVSGLGDRIVGIDRFSEWPPETAEIPRVGGYTDPSIERIASLDPTSIHISGSSPLLAELAETLGIPFYSYDFDTLEDIFASLDSLDSRYGAEAADFSFLLQDKLDSLAAVLEDAAPVSAMIVIYHERGSSSLTVAGRHTFFADILTGVNCSISAPGTGKWPLISTEGVIDLAPDRIICLYPGETAAEQIIAFEEEYWASLGFDSGRIHCLFDSYIMIPGGRIDMIAERICSCLL